MLVLSVSKFERIYKVIDVIESIFEIICDDDIESKYISIVVKL